MQDTVQAATSSTPRRETHANGSVVQPPRLTVAALNLRLTAGINHLEALANSVQHVSQMESLRQINAAQIESMDAAAKRLRMQVRQVRSTSIITVNFARTFY